MNPFSKNIRKALDRARSDERLKCQQEHERNKRIALDELSAEYDLTIAELKAEINSLNIRIEFYQDKYEKMKKENHQVRIDKKRNEKLGNDLYFIIKEYASKEAELVQKIGITCRDAGINLIERK